MTNSLHRLVIKSSPPSSPVTLMVPDMALQGVIFDMDGTLTQPQTYMFKQMRTALDILDKPIDILDYLSSLEPDEQAVANEKVKQIEENAMREMKPTDGLLPSLTFFKDNDVKVTICTRNLIGPVDWLCENYLPGITLDEPIVTRSFEPPKPSKKPLTHIMKNWGVEPENVIMVGDSRDDMFAGLNAGCAVVLLKHKDNSHLVDEIPQIDYVVENLNELANILRSGLVVKEKNLDNVKRKITGSGY